MHFCVKFFDHIDSIRCSLYFNFDLFAVLPAFSTIAFGKNSHWWCHYIILWQLPMFASFFFPNLKNHFQICFVNHKTLVLGAYIYCIQQVPKCSKWKIQSSCDFLKKINVAYKQKHDFFFAFKMLKLLGLFSITSLIKNSYNGYF